MKTKKKKGTGKIIHQSSCAVYNAPAMKLGPCNCIVSKGGRVSGQ